jgi:glycerate kinase
VTSTYGVGELLAVALEEGARRVVVGLGGSATNDGGAGMLAALGAQPGDRLAAGGLALHDLDRVDLAAARARVAGVEIVAAADVDNPLLGMRGATAVFGRQKGADDDLLAALEEALARFATLVDPDLADAPGAGAAGGLGFALLALGASRQPGIGTVLDAVDLSALAAAADLVVTGEGCFDWQSLRGKVVAGVAERGSAQARPVVVLAGLVQVGEREMRALGVSAAYSVASTPQERAESLARPVPALSALAARVARTWSR